VSALGDEPPLETFNPVIVDFYERVGYLPDALVNYLLLLGWSLDDRTEEFSREEMIRSFSLDRVNKAPASFDPDKLVAFEERYMLAVPLDDKVAMVLPYLQQAGLVAAAVSDETRALVREIVTAAGDRIKVAGDILDYSEFFVLDEKLAYDEKALDKRLRKPDDAASLLARFKDRLRDADSFDAASLERLMHDFVETEGIKIGRIIHAVRVAVTGKAVGFGLFEVLAILGRRRSISRIERALTLL
jgi:glutamyl-tRNA synthetase